MEQMLGEALKVAVRNVDEIKAFAGTPASIFARQQASATSSAPAQTTTPTSGGGGGGPTSSPLLFFVALGFGVVFTNLWIIVGVKYCFRYNARNRALRNGEDIDQINMENMPTRPHRRRREKKLMTMDEVNERFPLTKYKTWVATRLSAGLPTAGGVTAPPSRAGSVRDASGVIPASPVETKHSVNTRPGTAASDVVVTPDVNNEVSKEPKPTDKKVTEKDPKSETKPDESTPIAKQVTLDDDDEEDDHIHTAVPPELLTNPGDSCAICIDTLEDDDDIRGLTCGHAFHAGCIDPWLTSRRACCPLCKADYYTPKPRPEGEAAEAERNRRREGRNNPIEEPSSPWAGFRGSPRIFLPSRFGGTTVYPSNGNNADGQRRRDRRTAEPQAQGLSSNGTVAQENPTAEPTPSRWRNPFNSINMPRLPGRARQAGGGQVSNVEPSPSQLEAGTANTAVVR